MKGNSKFWLQNNAEFIDQNTYVNRQKTGMNSVRHNDCGQCITEG
ncbi:hypothetical protein [Nostoc sp.]